MRDPARTVPRALFIALIGITLLYLAVQLVAQGVLGRALATFKDAPLATASERFLGPAGRVVMLVGAVVSTLGYVGGMTLATPRSLFAFGRDGILPAAFARVHPRYRTPHVAIIVQATVACALAVSGGFMRLLVMADVSLVVLYLACCAAAWELRRRDVRAGGTPFNVRGGAVVPWLAGAVLLALLASVGPRKLEVVASVLAGSAFVFLVRRQLTRGAKPVELH